MSDTFMASARQENSLARHNKPWPMAEEKDLVAAFMAGHSLDKLAARHQRYPSAISQRLIKLGYDPEAAERVRNEVVIRYQGTDIVFDESTALIPSKHLPDHHQRRQERQYVNANHIITLLQKGYTTVKITFGETKTYTYKVADAIAATLKPDDLVVVPVYSDTRFALGQVAEVHPEPEIDVKAPYALKWLIAKVDLTTYNEQLAREDEAVKLLQKGERREAQRQAAEALLQTVGDSAALLALLNPKS